MSGRKIHAGGKVYDPEEFICEWCKTPLVLDTYYTVDGKNVCQSCRNKERCASCGFLITETKYVTLDDKTYHPDCFRCSECLVELDKKFYFEDNALFCSECINLRGSSDPEDMCPKCYMPLSGGIIKALGKKYHEDCFVCHSCFGDFPNDEFVNIKGNPFCDNCINDESYLRSTAHLKTTGQDPSSSGSRSGSGAGGYGSGAPGGSGSGSGAPGSSGSGTGGYGAERSAPGTSSGSGAPGAGNGSGAGGYGSGAPGSGSTSGGYGSGAPSGSGSKSGSGAPGSGSGAGGYGSGAPGSSGSGAGGYGAERSAPGTSSGSGAPGAGNGSGAGGYGSGAPGSGGQSGAGAGGAPRGSSAGGPGSGARGYDSGKPGSGSNAGGYGNRDDDDDYLDTSNLPPKGPSKYDQKVKTKLGGGMKEEKRQRDYKSKAALAFCSETDHLKDMEGLGYKTIRKK